MDMKIARLLTFVWLLVSPGAVVAGGEGEEQEEGEGDAADDEDDDQLLLLQPRQLHLQHHLRRARRALAQAVAHHAVQTREVCTQIHFNMLDF